MLRITLLILIVLPSVILAGCHYGKVVACPSGDPCTGVPSSYYCELDACDNCVARCFNKKGGWQHYCSARCPKLPCPRNPCLGVTSPYCVYERATCDKCVPRCFDKKGGEQLPCERKKCTVKPLCPENPCDVVSDKDCKSSCFGCKPICHGDDGKQIHCTMKTPCHEDVCNYDPCYHVISPYCERDACDNCVARCFDKKGGKELPCEHKIEERRASK